jgi:hypothetical protein
MKQSDDRSGPPLRLHNRFLSGALEGGLALGLVVSLTPACDGDPHHHQYTMHDASVTPLDGGGDGDSAQDAGHPDAATPDAGMDSGTADGGQDAGGWNPPELRNPVNMLDLDLAKQALKLMGSSAVGASGSCRTCHSLGRPTLSKWRRLTRDLRDRCLENTSLSDQASIDSMVKCIDEGGEGGGDGPVFDGADSPVHGDFVDGVPPVSDVDAGGVVADAGKPIGMDGGWVDFDAGTFPPEEDAGTPPSDPTHWRPEQLGIYAAAADLDWFKFLFRYRSDAGNWQAKHQAFVVAAGMPRQGKRFTQAEFDIVAEWFARGLPKLHELVPLEPGTAMCKASISPDMITHIAAMKTGGWREKHHENGLPMFGCKSGQSGAACLTDIPLAKDKAFSSKWDVLPNSHIRVLHDNSKTPSTYWSRASADGRFMASAGSGGEPVPDGGEIPRSDAGSEPMFYGATIFDFLNNRGIPVAGGVDPGFFPDNSGFVYQGSNEGGALVCDQSVLLNNPKAVDGTEPQCGSFGVELIGIYEALGKTVGGSDYWVAAGEFESDDGGFMTTLENPWAPFDMESKVTLTPMINEGNKFSAGTPTEIAVPQEGDPMLSPSGSLLITRVKGDEVPIGEDDDEVTEAQQNGYHLHQITTTKDKNGLRASIKEVARVCVQGGKPMLSYDERWMVIHRYVTELDAKELGFTGIDDPGFTPYLTDGASNLYLIDLSTGKEKRITNMAPGQYALYPHFRADNWLYFVVRTSDHREYYAASDAALLSE